MASLAVRLLLFLSSYAVIKKVLNVGKVLSIDRRLRHLSQSFVKKTCGLDVIIRPSHELGVIDGLVTFGRKELAIIQLVKQSFNGGWW